MKKGTNGGDWLRQAEYSMNAKRLSKRKQSMEAIPAHLDELRDMIFDCESIKVAGGKLRKISDPDSLAKVCALQNASRIITHLIKMLSGSNALDHLAGASN